ncbi:MAG: hypothetical protein ACOCM4_09425 [Acetivibrio ethanolgignens]
MPDNFDRHRGDNCPPCRCDCDRRDDRHERRDNRWDRRDDRWDRRDDRRDRKDHDDRRY